MNPAPRPDKQPAGDQFKTNFKAWIASRKPVAPRPKNVPNLKNHY